MNFGDDVNFRHAFPTHNICSALHIAIYVIFLKQKCVYRSVCWHDLSVATRIATTAYFSVVYATKQFKWRKKLLSMSNACQRLSLSSLAVDQLRRCFWYLKQHLKVVFLNKLSCCTYVFIAITFQICNATHTHTHTHTRTYIYIYTHTHTLPKFTITSPHTKVSVRWYSVLCVCVYIYIYIYMRVCVCVCSITDLECDGNEHVRTTRQLI